MPILPQSGEISLASPPFALFLTFSLASDGPQLVRTRTCTDGWPTLLYYDIKEARKRCRDAGNVEGALPWLGPHTICIGTLTSCCLRTSQDRSCDHLGVGLQSLAVKPPTVRDAHEDVPITHVRGRCDARSLAIVCKVLAALSGVVSETLVCRIQGPCEALVVILGGSETSDECSFVWYRRERAVLTCIPTISVTITRSEIWQSIIINL